MSTSTPHVPSVRRLLVVCAHPYDATFALGGVIAAFAATGSSIRVLCFTHGRRPDPGHRRHFARASELSSAARTLGVDDVVLLDFPAGHLAAINLTILTKHVVAAATGAEAILTVEATGRDAHPDHLRAMHVAFRTAIRQRLPLYARTVAARRGAGLNHVPIRDVDRSRQNAAIAHHHDLPAEDALARWRMTHRHEESLVLLSLGQAGRSAGVVAVRSQTTGST